LKKYMPSSSRCQRMTALAAPAGSSRRSDFARPSSDGRDSIQVGERCSIVTFAALCASAGTSVTAVAPLPMTTTRRPATSRSSGHCCG
jgi:hypothetical protein